MIIEIYSWTKILEQAMSNLHDIDLMTTALTMTTAFLQNCISLSVLQYVVLYKEEHSRRNGIHQFQTVSQDDYPRRPIYRSSGYCWINVTALPRIARVSPNNC